MREEEREHEVRMLRIKGAVDESLDIARYKHKERSTEIQLEHSRKLLSEESERANEGKVEVKTPEQLQSEQSEREHRERMRIMDLELIKGENASKEKLRAMELDHMGKYVLEAKMNSVVYAHKERMRAIEVEQERRHASDQGHFALKTRALELEHERKLAIHQNERDKV